MLFQINIESAMNGTNLLPLFYITWLQVNCHGLGFLICWFPFFYFVVAPVWLPSHTYLTPVLLACVVPSFSLFVSSSFMFYPHPSHVSSVPRVPACVPSASLVCTLFSFFYFSMQFCWLSFFLDFRLVKLALFFHLPAFSVLHLGPNLSTDIKVTRHTNYQDY